MTKRRRPKQPKHLGQAPAEQAVANIVSRRHRHETAEAPSARDRLFRRCPTCGLTSRDVGALTVLERVTDTADHRLAGFAQLNSKRVDEDGKPALKPAWLAYVDHAPLDAAVEEEDLYRAFEYLLSRQPTLAAAVLARLEHRQSARDLGRELGINHETAERIALHGLFTLKELMASAKL